MKGIRLQRNFAGDLIRRSKRGETHTCGLGEGEAQILDGLTDFHHFLGLFLEEVRHLDWVMDNLRLFLDEGDRVKLRGGPGPGRIGAAGHLGLE